MILPMRNKRCTTESLLSLIDSLLAEKGRLLLAIEGGAGSGKTTLAADLARRYGAAVFHMDDFFLRPAQRTPERLAEAGGNVDRERFLEEVLLPLHRSETVCHRRYNCATQSLLAPAETPSAPLTIVEGSYCMHPALAGYYDLSVFLQIPQELQRARILSRNGAEAAQRFFDLWIPMEERYFEATRAAERCNLILEVTP